VHLGLFQLPAVLFRARTSDNLSIALLVCTDPTRSSTSQQLIMQHPFLTLLCKVSGAHYKASRVATICVHSYLGINRDPPAIYWCLLLYSKPVYLSPHFVRGRYRLQLATGTTEESCQLFVCPNQRGEGSVGARQDMLRPLPRRRGFQPAQPKRLLASALFQLVPG